ncbi:phage portal protein [Rhodococcoides fascians]|uniref:phage portal protein n=1 Tax=Rhodococcoides fascians TaxID=1828 RepID=UPI00068F949A|nr:phage portal protein [Rhodococcus fascians]
MALPDGGGKFPPKPFDEAQNDFKTWNAWYTGSPADLETIYAGNNMMRQSAMPGGLIGRLAKFFWGRPNLQATSKLHIPAPADLARTSSDLLFSQPIKFSLNENDTARGDAADKRMALMFNSEDAASTLLEAGELCSALGGTYMRLWWDESISDHVMLGSVAADGAIPTWTYNKLTAVTFWTTVLDDNGIVLRHLERHEPGRISHALYQGDSGHLGRKVPLSEVQASEWAANVVDSEGGIETGVNGLTAAYIPNVRPNRRWRTKPGLTQLGRSDFDGLEPLFDALDEAYTSWMRDLDLGKARLFVDEGLMLNGGPGKGGVFDSEQAIFTPLREQLGSAANGNSTGVQANQFAIRWQEHSQTCAEILNAILRGAGLSAQGFSDSNLTVGVPTATEVNSKDRLSERTRDKKINYWKSGLRPLAKVAMDIDAEQFGTGITLSEIPEIRFPTRSTQSPAEMSGSISALASANAISTVQMVKEQHPNWTQPEIDAEVELIKSEFAEKNAMTGGMGFGDPQTDEEYDAA